MTSGVATAARAAAPAIAAVSLLAVVYAAALAVLVVGPPLLTSPFPLYPSLTSGDVLDALTPITLAPVAWLLFRFAAPPAPSLRSAALFVGLLALLIEGQAIHLAANTIGHHVEGLGGDLERLTVDLDELFSHLLWHGALIGIAGMVVWRGLEMGPAEPTRGTTALILIAAFLYGSTYFLMVVEGGTAAIGVPGAALVGGVGAWRARLQLPQLPAAGFLILGSLFALALFAMWAAMNGGTLPEFSDLGII